MFPARTAGSAVRFWHVKSYDASALTLVEYQDPAAPAAAGTGEDAAAPPPPPATEVYDVGNFLGQGISASVYEATSRTTEQVHSCRHPAWVGAALLRPASVPQPPTPHRACPPHPSFLLPNRCCRRWR